MTKQRKRYETWAFGQGARNFTTNEAGDYAHRVTNDVWIMWQAAENGLLPAMAKAAEQVEDYINDNDGRGPSDNHCPDCTMGVVPDSLNKGLCGYHKLQSLIEG
jgi:hypothetical protein